MKKALTLSVLLLANIAVLAHSAIPHHYHEGIPVAVAGLCNGACSAAADDAADDDDDDEAAHARGLHHHHDDPGSATLADCLLEKMAVRIADSNMLPDAFVGNILPLLCAPRLLSGSVDVPNDLPAVPFEQKTFVLPYHTSFIARSLGLRAPPAC